MSTKKELSFEHSLEKLENIVRELEEGQITLDDSLKKFEEGVSLYKVCKKSLGKAEKKIKVLTEGLKEEDLT